MRNSARLDAQKRGGSPFWVAVRRASVDDVVFAQPG
jgi:hypothetical protein